jgi:hypothetical protein
MDHTTDFALLGFVSVICVTLGRPFVATCIGLLGLFIYLR